jgi:ABC-type polysaccharide transport system permease subunit
MSNLTIEGELSKPKRPVNREVVSLYAMAIPLVSLVLVFAYVPIVGWSIAFFDYIIGVPVFETEFVGLKFFRQFLFRNPDAFLNALRNTLAMAFLSLIAAVIPVLLALGVNNLRRSGYSRFVQTTATFPHFISFTVVYSIFVAFFSVDDGVINMLLRELGLAERGFNPLVNPGITWFFQVFVVETWKIAGWQSIIYIAALTAIDPQLYEAAEIDGASRWQKFLAVTLPGIIPTFLILQLIRIGHLLSGANFQQILVFHNALVHDYIETLDYFVYRRGIQQYEFSYAMAVDIFRTLVSTALIVTVNRLSKRLMGRSII